MKGQTIQRVATPSAVLVGLTDALATVCTEPLEEGGLKVFRVGHVAAACERIPVVMPQLVVVLATLRPEEVDLLGDRCIAVGAEILTLAPNEDTRALAVTLRDAANMALMRALRRS